jgi:hypothetical protein
VPRGRRAREWLAAEPLPTTTGVAVAMENFRVPSDHEVLEVSVPADEFTLNYRRAFESLMQAAWSAPARTNGARVPAS